MTLQAVSKLAVLGGGQMGRTMIHALVDSGLQQPSQIAVTARHEATLDRLDEIEGLDKSLDNKRAISGADVVLVCVKPQGIVALFDEIRDSIASDQLVISIAAGANPPLLEEHLPTGIPVVRAMPNTPSLVGAGMTALCPGSSASEEHLAAARTIFESMGRAVVLDESGFDAVTGLAASGPAFIYMVIEALAEGGVKVGLPRAVAIELAAQACYGASKMVIETGSHPALLKDDVTTPAGCTVDGILELEEGGLRVTLIKAVVEAKRRAGELV